MGVSGGSSAGHASQLERFNTTDRTMDSCGIHIRGQRLGSTGLSRDKIGGKCTVLSSHTPPDHLASPTVDPQVVRFAYDCAWPRHGQHSKRLDAAVSETYPRGGTAAISAKYSRPPFTAPNLNPQELLT